MRIKKRWHEKVINDLIKLEKRKKRYGYYKTKAMKSYPRTYKQIAEKYIRSMGFLSGFKDIYHKYIMKKVNEK